MKNNEKEETAMLRALFAEEKIECVGVLPFSACRCRREDLIERRGITADEIRSAVIFLIPYYVKDGEGNISLYARSGDYHFYSDALFERLIPRLEAQLGGRFFGFADKSPIEENLAASMAGLGKLGDNYMLINERYGSFVFIGELLSTLPPESIGWDGTLREPEHCSHCGACRRACPMTVDGMECLSALTQKKGALTETERAYLKKYGSAWGCDLCQLVCPLNRAVLTEGRETPIDFFHHDRIPTLTSEMLEEMSGADFKRRAFSWRGKATLLRNLEILSE